MAVDPVAPHICFKKRRAKMNRSLCPLKTSASLGVSPEGLVFEITKVCRRKSELSQALQTNVRPARECGRETKNRLQRMSERIPPNQFLIRSSWNLNVGAIEVFPLPIQDFEDPYETLPPLGDRILTALLVEEPGGHTPITTVSDGFPPNRSHISTIGNFESGTFGVRVLDSTTTHVFNDSISFSIAGLSSGGPFPSNPRFKGPEHSSSREPRINVIRLAGPGP